MTASIDIDALWDFDDPPGSEARFREAWSSAPPHQKAEILTQMARAQGLQGHFQAAHQTLDAVEQELPPTLPRAHVRLLLERGRIYNSSGQTEPACALFRAAWEAARTLGEDFYAVDAAHMLGIAAPPEQQLEWHQAALALARGSADPAARRWLASLYNNLGWHHHAQQAYDQALECFQQALELRLAQGQPAPTRIARWCVARALRSLGRLPEALALQQALRAEWDQAGGQDGYVDEELGECWLALGQPETARPWFARAYAALSKDASLMKAEPARLARLRALGQGAE